MAIIVEAKMSSPQEKEITFSHDELIISKTDVQGKITYANRTFMRVSNYSEQQLLNQNHNIIRHPSMPRGVFYGLWKTLKSGDEFFGFVKNYTADKNYYWVFANITPDIMNGKIVGYYSVRRAPEKQAIKVISQLYSDMMSNELRMNKNEAPEKSWNGLVEMISQQHQQSYEEFVLALYKQYQN
ncbi:PAS domain-containing protein [Vibrio metoecus]|uniref:PAS domain-containing protein n=1 Tax=Vibrio metoecus TaxID=1481663 RepID=UPI001F3A58E6|nr:PAS domain-containing protein [Vibrio metoecus]